MLTQARPESRVGEADGMMSGWWLRALVVAGLLTASGCAARSTVGAYMNTPAPPANSAERQELCATYADRLEITRTQLRRRNALGRLDLLRAEHRAMERFVEEHCS